VKASKHFQLHLPTEEACHWFVEACTSRVYGATGNHAKDKSRICSTSKSPEQIVGIVRKSTCTAVVHWRRIAELLGKSKNLATTWRKCLRSPVPVDSSLRF